jgi:hypothetical protein
MKSQVPVLFNEWLTLMERAFEVLSTEQFVELECKIQEEIDASRIAKIKKVQKELPCGCMSPAASSRDICPGHRRNSGS